MSVATHSASPTWQLGAATHADMLGLEAVKGRRQLFHQVSPTVASSYLPPNGQLRHLKHSSGLRGGQLALDWAPTGGHTCEEPSTATHQQSYSTWLFWTPSDNMHLTS